VCQTVKLRALLAFLPSQELIPLSPLEKMHGHLVHIKVKKWTMVCNKQFFQTIKVMYVSTFNLQTIKVKHWKVDSPKTYML